MPHNVLFRRGKVCIASLANAWLGGLVVYGALAFFELAAAGHQTISFSVGTTARLALVITAVLAPLIEWTRLASHYVWLTREAWLVSRLLYIFSFLFVHIPGCSRALNSLEVPTIYRLEAWIRVVWAWDALLAQLFALVTAAFYFGSSSTETPAAITAITWFVLGSCILRVSGYTFTLTQS